jgi:uncharacterized SAM-binding protein YcdF (DUF218 family)
MEAYDVILTVGNGLTDGWHLPQIVENRLDYVASLYKRGISTKVLVSGGYSINWDLKGIKPPTTEAKEMRNKLIELGINAADILVEEESKDTIGNLYFSKKYYLKPLGLNQILIVCTDFHLKRVKFLAEKILGSSYKFTYQTTPSQSIADKDFMQIQEDILKAQSKFLEDMEVGDDSYLETRLYQDPYYQSRRPEKGALVGMKGVN